MHVCCQCQRVLENRQVFIAVQNDETVDAAVMKSGRAFHARATVIQTSVAWRVTGTTNGTYDHRRHSLSTVSEVGLYTSEQSLKSILSGCTRNQQRRNMIILRSSMIMRAAAVMMDWSWSSWYSSNPLQWSSRPTPDYCTLRLFYYYSTVSLCISRPSLDKWRRYLVCISIYLLVTLPWFIVLLTDDLKLFINRLLRIKAAKHTKNSGI